MSRYVLLLLLFTIDLVATVDAADPVAHAQAPAVIHINTATLAELDSLPGIGPSKAAAIIAARQRRPFRRLQDLLRVPGIGRATLERLAPFLAFDLPPTSPPAVTTSR